MSKSKPLVTIFTANSNSGKHCVEELFKNHADKVRVRGVFRSEQKAEPFRLKYPSLEIVTGVDASKPETLEEAPMRPLCSLHMTHQQALTTTLP